MTANIIQNPILTGNYPDPSICKVNDDFFMINSSFAFFPGIPIFHSKDLMHWHQIGYALDRPGQLALCPDLLSGGIFAPTIRYHDGTYYIICTNICDKGNFIITADTPYGPWSDPHWIEGAEGIDPSLFWDEDGTAYYTGTVGLGKEPSIWISKIDLEHYRIVEPKINLWSGALKDCHTPEGPHIYKKDGWYYLMIAEGGTEMHHAVTIARSRNIEGPYEGNPANPILTHRHLGMNYPICNVGHGDLVSLDSDTWYMVMLGSRVYGGYHKNMGRETFITPVVWENGWPIVSPGTGKVEWTYPAPEQLANCDEEIFQPDTNPYDNFSGDKLHLCWNTVGTPLDDLIKTGADGLQIKTIARRIVPEEGAMISWLSSSKEHGPLGFVGRRQQDKSFRASTKLHLTFVDGHESAGMIMLQNAYHSIRVELAKENDQITVSLILGYIEKNFEFGLKTSRGDSESGDIDWNFQHNPGSGIYHQELIQRINWPSENVAIYFIVNDQTCDIELKDENDRSFTLAEKLDIGFMGTETAGGCIGTYVGMYASGNGYDLNEYAEFKWFEYR